MLVALVLEVAISIVLVRGPSPPSFSGPCCCSGGTFATTHSRGKYGQRRVRRRISIQQRLSVLVGLLTLPG